jgi:DNA-binding transcriptional ArsR family regulator
MAFEALAEPRRRLILDLLREQPRSVGELVAATGLSQPGTSKHLRVLRESGLVRCEKDAQRRVYALDPDGLAELIQWVEPYRRLWAGRLDALERHLDETAEPTKGMTS